MVGDRPVYIRKTRGVDALSFLTDNVLPSLDAGKDLLDDLNPKWKTRYWALDCPACGKAGRAYYFPGNYAIQCNARGDCGESTTVWDFVASKHSGASQREIFERLCQAAGVTPPTRETGPTEVSKCAAAVKKELSQALLANASASAYLEKTRGYPRDTWERLGFGYYPSAKWLRLKLSKADVDLAIAQRWGILPDEEWKTSQFEGRIVGWWRQEDESVRLWGRLIGEPSDDRPKYYYSPGMSKTVPYRFRKPGRATVIGIEGAMDQAALEMMGVPACAVGGNHVNAAQAAHLASSGTESLLFFRDADSAGEKGALQTITNCESRGIACFFACGPEGYDVDEMRREGRIDEILELIDSAANAGAILANSIIAGAGSTRNHFEVTREALRLRGLLTPYSWSVFERICTAAGFSILPAPAEALRVMSSLLSDGVRMDDAQALIKRRFGLNINVEVDRHGRPV